MLRHVLAAIATIIVVATPAFAGLIGPTEDGYGATPGVVTTEGVPGFFINPSTGQLAEKQFAANFCMYSFEVAPDTISAWNFLAAYGVTDWLHIGAMFFNVAFKDVDLHGGPFIQAQLVGESAKRPEVAIGGIFREGDESFRRRTLYVAASKGWRWADGAIRSVRPTVGFRQIWEANDFNDSLFYFGGEIEFPMHLYFVGEVGNKHENIDDVPFSVGVQLRHPAGPAFSFGWVNADGGLDDPGLFVGIGIGLD